MQNSTTNRYCWKLLDEIDYVIVLPPSYCSIVRVFLGTSLISSFSTFVEDKFLVNFEALEGKKL